MEKSSYEGSHIYELVEDRTYQKLMDNRIQALKV